MGRTISNALREADESNPIPKKLRDKSEALKSESNGSLMRITPLAIYLSRLEDEDRAIFEKIIKAEVSLTHSTEIVKEAAICYCIAIQSLIKNRGDRKAAYKKAW